MERENSDLRIRSLLIWPFMGWMCFCLGYALTALKFISSASLTLILSAGIFLGSCLFLPIFLRRKKIFRSVEDYFICYTSFIDNISDSKVSFCIILAAGLSLFIELMIIRIHASCFQLFAYFKNVSLLSCFLGLGIGFAQGKRKTLLIPVALPFLAAQIIYMFLLRYADITVYRLIRNPVVEQVTFGLPPIATISHCIFVYGFTIMIFTFNAICFIPLGQLNSRLMMRKEKLRAYSWNLIGSVGGIILFMLLSFLGSPPLVWVVVATAGIIVFYYKDLSGVLVSFASLILVVVVLSLSFSINRFDFYSPYQILTFGINREKTLSIETSNTFYQGIFDLRKESIEGNEEKEALAAFYNAPYFVKKSPKDVLILGSGTGNDVAAGLRNNSGQIDAVDIDPVIVRFGKEFHPEKPYQAPNVDTHINDARSFINHTDKNYDLIVFGLVDSHTLLSSSSGGIRLDSYVYTIESFRQARKHLKEGGVICLSFALKGPHLAVKIFHMLKETFDGQEPIVARVSRETGIIFLIGDRINRQTYTVESPLVDNTNHLLSRDLEVDVSTDNWPFLYMPKKLYPRSYVVMIVLLLLVSLGLIKKAIPEMTKGFSGACFFLGAGFMLIETKAITELALVYGSTWVVTSIVIAAILVMAFLANALMIRVKNIKRSFVYILLGCALLMGYLFSFVDFSHTGVWLERVMKTAILTVPIFFSGFAFSSELRRSSSVAVALSSNLLGAMVGGFVEYNSMYFGFRALYVIALAMYVLAFVSSRKKHA
ncbi:MAG: hypothetical protein ABH872_06700 [Candidatus Omnitrophota bacterium]